MGGGAPPEVMPLDDTLEAQAPADAGHGDRVPGGEEVGRLFIYLVVSIVYIGFWLGVAILCSALFRGMATSALAALALWIFFAFFMPLAANLLAGAIERAVAGDATQRNSIRDVSRYTDAQDKAMGKGPALLPQAASLGAGRAVGAGRSRHSGLRRAEGRAHRPHHLPRRHVPRDGARMRLQGRRDHDPHRGLHRPDPRQLLDGGLPELGIVQQAGQEALAGTPIPIRRWKGSCVYPLSWTDSDPGLKMNKERGCP